MSWEFLLLLLKKIPCKPMSSGMHVSCECKCVRVAGAGGGEVGIAEQICSNGSFAICTSGLSFKSSDAGWKRFCNHPVIWRLFGKITI